jgi:hypothetical protein
MCGNKKIAVLARFFAHVQTGPGAHLASCTMGTGSFPGVKRPGRGADNLPLLVLRSRKSRAIPLPPSGPSSLLRGTFTLVTLVTTTGLDNLVDILTRLLTGQSAFRFPTGARDCFASPKRPDHLGGPPSFLFNTYLG